MPQPPDTTTENVSARLKEADQILIEADRIFETETTEEHKTQWPNVYRLESATKHAREILPSIDPRIALEAAADEAHAAAVQARDAIRAAVDSGGGDLIGSANRLLTATTQLEPALLTSDGARAAGAAAVARLHEIQEEFEGRIRKIDQQIAGSDQRSGESEAKRSDAFEEAEKNRSREFRDALQTASQELAQARSSFDDRADEARNHISELEDEIGQTAAALGGRAIAIDNNKESEEQAKRAFWWTVLTVALLVLAAGVPLLIGVENADQTPESVAGKITVGLILAGIASYTAGVARHHRQRSATARRLAIELNAFGPFVAPLEKADRDDLRSTIVWRFFGPPKDLNQESDSEPTPGPRILQILNSRRSRREPPAPEA
jgi:hypothetical protein